MNPGVSSKLKLDMHRNKSLSFTIYHIQYIVWKYYYLSLLFYFIFIIIIIIWERERQKKKHGQQLDLCLESWAIAMCNNGRQSRFTDCYWKDGGRK